MLLGGIRYLLPAIEAAHKHGCYVITVDYLPDNIAHKYSDEYHNVSILDKEAVLQLARELKIDGILSYAVDPGVTAAAYVAEQMGLPFTCSYESACILQDKSRFRQFLSENGVNVPNAKGYTDANKALKDVNYFNWPVIVKPVDSAGSKGVTRVDDPKDLEKAIETALDASHNGHFIIEDFLELDGYQSSADCFSVDGQLVYADYSDQLFDKDAANPYTPSIEIWPSTMPKDRQDELTKELQRLITLLGCGTGLYNVESRVCKNGKAYLMEVSPRAGGNRIAELQRIGTGIDLIEAEVLKAIGEPVKGISQPIYDGVYVNDIIHSNISGKFCEVRYDESFKEQHFISEAVYPRHGDSVEAFRGANNAVGSVFLRFRNREDANKHIVNHNSNINVIVEEMEPIGGYFSLELPTHGLYHSRALALNTGRNCLEYILRVRQYRKVYIPFYTCDVLLEPFNKLGVAYEFYHINEDLEVVGEIDLQQGEALLCTNYFGLKQQYMELMATKYGRQLIIDNTQAFYARPIDGIDTFYTCRKFFGVPDGAYLYIDKTLDEDLERDVSWERMTFLNKRIDLGAEAGYADFKELSRSLVGQPIKRMSKLTARIMCSIDYQAIARQRRENYHYLNEHLASSNLLHLKMDEEVVPMVYPYWAAEDGLREKLIENKVFVARYWPNVPDWTTGDSLESKLVRLVQHLPVDQRYGRDEMNRIIGIIRNE